MHKSAIIAQEKLSQVDNKWTRNQQFYIKPGNLSCECISALWPCAHREWNLKASEKTSTIIISIYIYKSGMTFFIVFGMNFFSVRFFCFLGSCYLLVKCHMSLFFCIYLLLCYSMSCYWWCSQLFIFVTFFLFGFILISFNFGFIFIQLSQYMR